MTTPETLPRLIGETEARLIIVEAPPGPTRRQVLEKWLGEPCGQVRLLLDCDLDRGGIWAGLSQWLSELYPALAERAPELVDRHSHELVTVVPSLRKHIRSRKTTLTDEAQAGETVRNYAVDRGYRIGHGVIDLIDAWRSIAGDPGYVVVCLNYDRAGALVRRFFRELMRRRGRALALTLVPVVAPGMHEEVAVEFASRSSFEPSRVCLDLPAEATPSASLEEMRRRAESLEAEVAADPLAVEIRLPELILTWSQSDCRERALSWKAFALGLYNHYGFYEDSYRYVEPVLANLDSIEPIKCFEYFFTRWNLVGSVFGCLVANGEPQRAFQVVKEEALEKITEDKERARIHYVLAMLYGRFLPEPDLARAEEHLAAGLRILEEAKGLAERDRVFLTVFLENGLAYIRHRQGRPREAIELCRSGFQQMNDHWQPNEHRLHRSVLLYNQAQVYSALRLHEEAIAKFTEALAMDPNYSEYYNERGNVYLSMGRFEDAIRDYYAAISSSPPYPEVWVNLGQCYRRMGQLELAEHAFSRVLDLEPDFALARIGRAQILDELGRAEEAEADYDKAIDQNPEDPLLLANRAVLRFQRGACRESLADLDRAIVLAPELGELYRNRAFALQSLGLINGAREDLGIYLRLVPNAADRTELEVQIGADSAT